MPRWIGCAVLFLGLAVHLTSAAQSQSQGSLGRATDEAKLAQILQKTAEYCRRLENAVLDFVCLEEVKEKIYAEIVVSEFATGFLRVDHRPLNNSFLYEYQLIRNANKTEEVRTLIEKNGERCREKATEVGTLQFRFEKIIYGPVDLLRLPNQSHFDYAIIKEDSKPAGGEIIVEAVPKPDQKEYLPFGKIWVRGSDFAILKIEYDRLSIQSLYEENQAVGPKKDKARFELTSEFDVERNGIRFPSRVVFQETDPHKSGQASVRSRAMITYKDYRFFSVIVDIDFR